jgi:PleD family two-component response regulator
MDSHEPGLALTQELIFQKADEMLYRAKQGGRNMVVSEAMFPDRTA